MEKNKSHVFASSLMASTTNRANFTWLPLENMPRSYTVHDMITCDLEWRDYCIYILDMIIVCKSAGADFENSFKLLIAIIFIWHTFVTQYSTAFG